MPGTFFPVDIRTFRSSAKDITFDVYLKLAEENYAHIFSKTSGIDYKRLANYLNKGVTHLYIRSEDEPLFREYLQRSPDKVFMDPKVPESKKVSILLNMAEQNMQELFGSVQVSEEAAAVTVKVVRNFINLMAENPKTLATLLKTASHGEYLFYHSVSVAVISMFIAKASGQANLRMLEICGFGGFLHDIGMTMVPREILDSQNPLTAAQWREVRLHPKYGVRMVENTPNVPDEVRYIILQHHEEPGGSGYPSGLRGPVIFIPAKIVGLADAFSAMISKRPYRDAYTVEQAIATIQKQQGRYDREIVKTLVDLFGQKKKAAVAA